MTNYIQPHIINLNPLKWLDMEVTMNNEEVIAKLDKNLETRLIWLEELTGNVIKDVNDIMGSLNTIFYLLRIKRNLVKDDKEI